MIDLSFLTDEEQEAILKVLQRDADLKRTEEERIRPRLLETFLAKSGKGGRQPGHSPGAKESVNTMRQVYQLVEPINPNFCFLQCTSVYPLQVIVAYRSWSPDSPVGYSSHKTGIAIFIVAVAMGAKVPECHITLDKTWKGSGHQASLEPNKLLELVRSIRMVEKAMGSPVKCLLPCEVACKEKLGKSIVAKVRILEGTTLTLDMLMVKVGEPKGHLPEDIFGLVGKKVKINTDEAETVTEDTIENLMKKSEILKCKSFCMICHGNMLIS
ncbi:UNVERIFIED_CONTAM: hypothetical protein K2H54_069261 [Gekko kuhli]